MRPNWSLSFKIFENYINQKSWKDLSLPLWQAHRGNCIRDTDASMPMENSLEALVRAISRGAPMAEVDLRRGPLGPILAHDEPSKQQTQGGQDFRQGLQLVGAPSLREILRNNQIPETLNLELKSIPRSFSEVGYFEAEVLQLLMSCPVPRKYLISSFDPRILAAVAMLAPQFPRAFIYGRQSSRAIVDPMYFLALAQPDLFHFEEEFLKAPGNSHWMAALKKRHVPYAVWTVNEAESARKWLSLGALSVISDRDLSQLL